jgi:hypothetical protein
MNSANWEEESLREVLPVINEFGVSMIGFSIDVGASPRILKPKTALQKI